MVYPWVIILLLLCYLNSTWYSPLAGVDLHNARELPRTLLLVIIVVVV